MAYGKFRIKGEPDLVQVQFGPFARPIPENEYRVKGYQPAPETLSWLADGASGRPGACPPRTGALRQ